MTFPDVRRMDPVARQQAALAVKRSADVAGFPRLAYWNYDPCPAHAGNGGPVTGCRACGVQFRKHQKVGVTWLALAGRALLADSTGTGKTVQVAGLLAALKETGELGTGNRAVIVPRASAIGQWQAELRRMIPRIAVVAATEDRATRARRLLAPWEVCLIGPEMLANKKAGGVHDLLQFPIGTVVADDIDPLHDRTNRTSWAIRKLAERASRYYPASATPLQKRLLQLYDILEPAGGKDVFGSRAAYEHRYVETRKVWYTVPGRPGTCPRCGGTVRYRRGFWENEAGQQRCVDGQPHASAGGRIPEQKYRTVETGVVEARLPEFQARLEPLVLRRTDADLDDVSMPEVVPVQVWLDPTKEQQRRYAELRKGVLRTLNEHGEAVTRPAADAAWMRGWQICSGLATLDENGHHDDSAKLDWVADKMSGDLAASKAVVFVNFKPNVAALAHRLAALGIGYEVIWGNDRRGAERERAKSRFWHDPGCRVLIGTTSIEQSLNLQVAQHLIAVDTIMNPQRMVQLIGRIKRDGSPFRTVWFHQLLLRGTQEDYIPDQLAREQGLADQVWGERSTIFARAQPVDLLNMILGREGGNGSGGVAGPSPCPAQPG
jgi:SNF2-related domain/Helicase conserved C-terminal domain